MHMALIGVYRLSLGGSSWMAQPNQCHLIRKQLYEYYHYFLLACDCKLIIIGGFIRCILMLHLKGGGGGGYWGGGTVTCSYNAGGGGGSGYIGGSKDGKHKLKSGKFCPPKHNRLSKRR